MANDVNIHISVQLNRTCFTHNCCKTTQKLFKRVLMLIIDLEMLKNVNMEKFLMPDNIFYFA